MREFFTETTLIQFTYHCDVRLLESSDVKSGYSELLAAIKAMEEDGKPLFTMVIDSAGSVDLRLRVEKTDREVKMIRNRINTVMCGIMSRQSAA